MSKNKKPYIFLVMGPQGSGKGTQAELLAQKFKLEHFDTGNMLRQMAKRKSKRAKEIKDYMEKGKLLPWQWIIEIAVKQLKKAPFNKGFVYDGLSRRLPEAKAFLKMIKQSGREITAVFLIDIPAQETIKRLSERRICSRGHIFRVGLHLKKNEKKCPQCGSELFQRADDKPVAIRKRLQDYKEKTIPSLNYFKQAGLLIKINGQQPIKKVFSDIQREIKKLAK